MKIKVLTDKIILEKLLYTIIIPKDSIEDFVLNDYRDIYGWHIKRSLSLNIINKGFEFKSGLGRALYYIEKSFSFINRFLQSGEGSSLLVQSPTTVFGKNAILELVNELKNNHYNLNYEKLVNQINKPVPQDQIVSTKSFWRDKLFLILFIIGSVMSGVLVFAAFDYIKRFIER